MKRAGYFLTPESHATYHAALRELEHVHRSDQARLLRRACALACADSALGRLYVAGRGCEPLDPSGARALRRWHDACAEEIASAHADAFPVHSVLASLFELPLERWPGALELAEASLELESSDGGRLALARARTSADDPRGAIRLLRELLAERPIETIRRAALEALGLAFEAAGELRSSIRCFERAVAEKRSDVRVAVSLLSLALRAGDRRAVDIASARLAPLDLSVAGTRRRFDRAVDAARARAERDAPLGAPSSRRGPRQRILELSRAGPPACSEVARSLL